MKKLTRTQLFAMVNKLDNLGVKFALVSQPEYKGVKADYEYKGGGTQWYIVMGVSIYD